MDNTTENTICNAASRGLRKKLPGDVPEHVAASITAAAAKHARATRRWRMAKLAGGIAAVAVAMAIVANVPLWPAAASPEAEAQIDTYMALAALTAVMDDDAMDESGDPIEQTDDTWAADYGAEQDFDMLADGMLRMQESAMPIDDLYAFY